MKKLIKFKLELIKGQPGRDCDTPVFFHYECLQAENMEDVNIEIMYDNKKFSVSHKAHKVVWTHGYGNGGHITPTAGLKGSDYVYSEEISKGTLERFLETFKKGGFVRVFSNNLKEHEYLFIRED